MSDIGTSYRKLDKDRQDQEKKKQVGSSQLLLSSFDWACTAKLYLHGTDPSVHPARTPEKRQLLHKSGASVIDVQRQTVVSRKTGMQTCSHFSSQQRLLRPQRLCPSPSNRRAGTAARCIHSSARACTSQSADQQLRRPASRRASVHVSQLLKLPAEALLAVCAACWLSQFQPALAELQASTCFPVLLFSHHCAAVLLFEPAIMSAHAAVAAIHMA